MKIDEIGVKASEILDQINSVILGYEKEVKLLLASLLANGHVLLEGVPGIAKTTLIKALAKTLGLYQVEREINGVKYRGFSRIQFTPDLMPSDITGSLVFNPSTREFEPRLGPLFSYIVLADEINRAIPRTQSALLQAMQEREVTIGDKTFPLEVREAGKFFFVLATQNPVEQEGTYPLPEAQLDRFLMRIVMDYPESIEVEKEVYKLHLKRVREPFEDLVKVVEPGWIIEAQDAIAKGIEVPMDVLDYVVMLIRNSRPKIFPPIAEYFELGASPRAGINLLKAAKAYAALNGKTVVDREDVDEVLFSVLNHRLIPNFEKLVELEAKGERFIARYSLIREGIDYLKKHFG